MQFLCGKCLNKLSMQEPIIISPLSQRKRLRTTILKTARDQAQEKQKNEILFILVHFIKYIIKLLK